MGCGVSYEATKKEDKSWPVFSRRTMQSASEKVLSAARRLTDFINKCPSPFHVVQLCRQTLVSSGFKELNEKVQWSDGHIKKTGKYFVVRNNSTIIAFAIGGKYQAGNGFSVIGSHTDSPCLKVKPKSKKEGNGYLSVGVECYGGGIWATWFDRDLTIAGRAIVKSEQGFEEKILHIDRPILRVPHLAIHLKRDVNDSFGPNKEKHIVPILATTHFDLPDQEKKVCAKTAQGNNHHGFIIDAVCHELNCDAKDLYDLELCLADTQNATIGGIRSEFIFAPRLDNLFNVFSSLEALIESFDGDSLINDASIRMIACFDNEEVGSQSAQGAASNISILIMKRILAAIGTGEAFETAMANSFIISADQAHAVHPNFAEKHEENHKPALHMGPVLKFNSNQRYATTAVSASILRAVAEQADVKLQSVVVRNDSPCGSTIGPILSSKLGVRTVDIGGPMLSMHSIREMCCTTSVTQTIALYKAFFQKFPEIDASFK